MKLLQELTQTPSVPGREDRIRKVIQDYVTKQNLFDEITVDAMGSLIGVRRPRPEKGKASKKPIKVMLAAHMDQIGFLVRHIDGAPSPDDFRLGICLRAKCVSAQRRVICRAL